MKVLVKDFTVGQMGDHTANAYEIMCLMRDYGQWDECKVSAAILRDGTVVIAFSFQFPMGDDHRTHFHFLMEAIAEFNLNRDDATWLGGGWVKVKRDGEITFNGISESLKKPLTEEVRKLAHDALVQMRPSG